MMCLWQGYGRKGLRSEEGQWQDWPSAWMV
jgi:hypothetical protein